MFKKTHKPAEGTTTDEVQRRAFHAKFGLTSRLFNVFLLYFVVCLGIKHRRGEEVICQFWKSIRRNHFEGTTAVWRVTSQPVICRWSWTITVSMFSHVFRRRAEDLQGSLKSLPNLLPAWSRPRWPDKVCSFSPWRCVCLAVVYSSGKALSHVQITLSESKPEFLFVFQDPLSHSKELFSSCDSLIEAPEVSQPCFKPQAERRSFRSLTPPLNISD